MRLPIAGLTLAALAMAACSGQQPSTTATSAGAASSGAPSAPAASATAPGSSTSTSASGVTTYQPADAPREAVSPDPNFDYGFVVQITSDGFRPKSLVSGCCRAVTWKNLTGKPASVVFDHQKVDSGPIAPGATFVYTPQHPVSITYHSSTDPSLTGILQVQQEFES